MTQMTTTPRPWRSYDHLRDLIERDFGAFTVQPLRAGDVHFDAGWSNGGQHGSTALDIGRGVTMRATGNARLIDGRWTIDPRRANFSRDDSRNDPTALQIARTVDLLTEQISEWASTHAGDIAQADDIDRNNGAHRLEETIARHEAALTILREQLRACEEGEPFTMYPDLPTGR
jgi:hypothetical protein